MNPQDDYVPSNHVTVGTEPFDYTGVDRSGNVPFGDDIDLDTEVNTDFLDGTSADDIEKSSYHPPKPGVHVFEVSKLEWVENGKLFANKVYVKRLSDGEVRAMSFDSKILRVTFSVLGDPYCTIRDQFTMAPTSREELEAYEYGFGKEDQARKEERARGGFAAKKLKHFLARLGFQNDANGKIPPSANKLRNWMFYEGTDIKKQIKMEITPPAVGNPYIDKKTGEKVTPTKAFPNIKFFSYGFVPEPSNVGVSRSMNRAASMPQAQLTEVPTESKSQPQNGGSGKPKKPVIQV